MKFNYDYHGSEIAIIGVAARFPGADSVDEFWQNLCLQRETIRFFTDAELAAAGVPEPFIPLVVASDANIRAGKFDVASDAVRRLTGVVALSVREFLTANKAAWLKA